MIKIFFNNKPLYLTDQVTKDLEVFLHRNDSVFIDEFSPQAVRTMIYEMGLPDIYSGVFLHSDVTELLNAFREELVCIQAAGGFVYTEESKVLMIFRRGRWDLPKGKRDEGEDLEACALREIWEETGVRKLKLQKPLAITYHTYHQNGDHILKESHWFLIRAEKGQVLKPQEEEDIEECVWADRDSVKKYLGNIHASLADVIHLGLREMG